MDVALEVHDAARDAWNGASFAYDDLVECPVCHEGYYDGPCVPHATCDNAHTCCISCFDRLPRVSSACVSCPTCRATTDALGLAVASERDGLYGALFARGRMRWRCAGCAFAAQTLCLARAHAGICARVDVRCPVCNAPVRRGELAAHATRDHPTRVAHVGGTVTEATRVLVLPRGFVLELGRGVCTVLCVGSEPSGTSFEVALASRAAVTIVDVTEMLLTNVRATKVHAEFPMRVTLETRVPLCMLPDRALLRVAGTLVAHMPEAHRAASETTVVSVRGSRTPQRLPLLTRVSVCPPRRGARCWARIDARFVFGQFERYDGDRALVRLATGLAAAPREHCGALLSD